MNSIAGPVAAPPTARTLRHPVELVESGLVPAEKLAALEAVAARYAVAITAEIADAIEPANPADPLARQFIPDPAELDTRPEELADPIGDDIHEVFEGLIHRYPDRALLKFVNACAVYCRFCFRRETVGPHTAHMSRESLEKSLRYIRAHPEIWEVVVSGGDPLIAAPRRISELVQALAAIDHVKIVRFHTRVPMAAPEKVTEAFVSALKSPGITSWVAIHANHPREFTPAACLALARLANSGVPLVSQTVLLAGVNDDTATLSALMRAFVENRVKPYYLHHGDLAPGTGHFRTPIQTGQDLMRAMRGDVSGLCQPTYVLDIPGGHGKAPIGPSYVAGDGDDLTVEDYRGRRHAYRQPDRDHGTPTET